MVKRGKVDPPLHPRRSRRRANHQARLPVVPQSNSRRPSFTCFSTTFRRICSMSPKWTVFRQHSCASAREELPSGTQQLRRRDLRVRRRRSQHVGRGGRQPESVFADLRHRADLRQNQGVLTTWLRVPHRRGAYQRHHEPWWCARHGAVECDVSLAAVDVDSF